MKRRDFLALAGATAAFPRVAFAQQSVKVPRIAVLSIPLPSLTIKSFEDGLADHGYVVGKSILVEFFTAQTNADLPVVAEKAVASKPDIIWMNSSQAAQATRDLTKTIPIVFYTGGDPVQLGLVQSLAHPGGNLTGSVGFGAVAGKILQLLREVIPPLSRIAVFEMTAAGVNDGYLADLRGAADALNISVVLIDVKEGEDFRTYFSRATEAGAQAVYAFSTTYTLQTPADEKLVAEIDPQSRLTSFIDPSYLAAQSGVIGNGMLLSYLAVLNQLPLVSISPAFAQSGALIGYGVNGYAIYRRAGFYIDAILRGAKPADLPVERPTAFDLGVNLKTAKGLGLTIPPSLVAQAAQVIE